MANLTKDYCENSLVSIVCGEINYNFNTKVPNMIVKLREVPKGKYETILYTWVCL